MVADVHVLHIVVVVLLVSIRLQAEARSYVGLAALARPEDHVGARIVIVLGVVLAPQLSLAIPLLHRLIVGRVTHCLIYRLHFLLREALLLIFIETDIVGYIFVSCALPERAKGSFRARRLLPRHFVPASRCPVAVPLI